MKLLIIATFITLACSNAFFLRHPFITEPLTCAPQSISDYYTALFDSFGLDKPIQLLKCFDDKSTALYFKHISELSDLVVDTEERNHVSVHLDWLKLRANCKALEPVWGCMAATQDWTDLLEALGAKERDPRLFHVAAYIYIQANYGKLAKELPPVVTNIKNANYCKAGVLKAAAMNSTANEFKEKGLGLIALKAFWNGVHIGLSLPDAKSIYKCWDDKSATVRLEFLYGMSKAVAEGSVSESSYNLEKWYDETGKDLASKITEDHWKCWKTADDTKAESEKIGVDITSEDFWNQVSKYVHSQQGKFWAFQKTIKENLEDHNLIHAGYAHAGLLQAVANSE